MTHLPNIRLTIAHIILAIATAFAAVSCEDNFPADNFGPTGEGEVTLQAAIDFRPMAGALTRSAGDAISKIDNIWVLLYDTEQSLVYSAQIKRENVTITRPSRTDSDTGTAFDAAEDSTERASFTLTVPYGHYYMYAVANVGDINDYTYQIQNVERLKAIRFNWQTDDVSKNSQMFGFFSPQGENYVGDVAPLVRIDGSTSSLNAWVRRVASKVTVAFDGSKLREGVQIFVKSVSIKDIPYSSQLGEGNAVKPTDSPLYADVHDSQTITFAEGSQDRAEELWPCITRENPTGGSISSDHSPSAEALYFYENMQGQGDGKEKWQDADGDGKVDYPGANDPESDDFKDNKDGRSLGTYIEVEAYYKSELFDNTGSGRIVYRFMLGKDTEKDYNAERNHHYKLTLCFRGNANEVDWHIDYHKDPGIFFPKPYYISYLYNKSLTFPVTIVGNVTGQLKAYIDPTYEINKNSWGPDKPDASLDFYKGDVENAGPWNGFLKLKGESKIVVPGTLFGNENQTYWEQHGLGERYYSTTPSDTPYEEGTLAGGYTVTRNGQELNFDIPLYTRAKQLVKVTAYTGNNVFTAYRRRAVVTFSATINGKEVKADAEIIQVERVANPKAVWRSSGCKDPFHAVLKIREKESDKTFINVNSAGPWRAKLDFGSDGWEISADGVNYHSGPVEGMAYTDVAFWIRPKSTIGENEIKCGMVTVTYHDNSCIHQIHLRQGYSPLDVADDGIKWHSFNMYAKNTPALSPLEEGSYFKYGNWDDAILASNNTTLGYGVAPGSTPLALAGGTSKAWTSITPCEVNLKQATVEARSFEDPTTMGANVRVTKFSDFKKLYEDPGIDFGYGVLYGDGAEETASTEDEAYGYYRNGTVTRSTKGMRGCIVYNSADGRNIFFPIGAAGYGHRKAQYDENLDNGFAGVLRYAGRSHKMTDYDAIGKKSYIANRPLFYDVYRSNGAVYYLRETDHQSVLLDEEGNHTEEGCPKPSTAWDINYHTFDFYTYWIDATSCSNGAYGMQKNTANIKSADACFVRCVTDTNVQ